MTNSRSSPLKVNKRQLAIKDFNLYFRAFNLDWEDGATANKIELSAAFTEDWDDQTIEDDFANQLRAELQKMSK